MDHDEKIMQDILVTIEAAVIRVSSLTYDYSEQSARIVKDLSDAYLNLMHAKALKLSMTEVLELKEGGATCKGPFT